MASKLQYYQSVSARAVKDVTAKRENWTDFLDTAAKIYKYPFAEQLMIHAQRPNAAACAPLEMWNDVFNRWVRRGSKGIALIDDTGSYPHLKYVFDVSDTEPSIYRSRPVQLWAMRDEHEQPVLDYLSGVYDGVEGNLIDSFYNIAEQLAAEYYEDNAQEIRYRAEDSFLEDFDGDNLRAAFTNALTGSIAYTVTSRCGFDADEYFEDDDFKFISSFNTPDMVYALGAATSDLSEQVLRDIEIVVKKYERQHTAERGKENERTDNIYTGWGLSSAGHQTQRTAEGDNPVAGDLREKAEGLSERTQENNLHEIASGRNAVPAPSGNGRGGEQPDGTGDGAADGGERTARQGQRLNGLDGGNERAESPSGGNGTERTDIRLNGETQTPPGQQEPGGVFSAPDRYRYYSTQRPVDIGAYPRENGNPVEIHNYDTRTPVEDGAFTAWGWLEYAQPLTEKQISDYELRAAGKADPIPMWEAAQYHSDWNSILTARVPANYTVLSAALNGNESDTLAAINGAMVLVKYEIAQSIADSPAIKNKSGVLAELADYFTKDRKPPLRQQLYDMVINSEAYKNRLAEKTAAMTEENEPPPPDTYSQLGNSLEQALSTSSVSIDEVDSILRDGGNDDNSVLRIAAHFAKDLSPEENTNFLRNEYLMGRWGRSPEPGGKGFQFGAKKTAVWFDETGITIGRGKSALYAADYARITWEQAASRVKELYGAGRYVSHDVLDEALYNETKERADDIVEVYHDIVSGLNDIQYELRKAMDKEQREAFENDWKAHRYLISGLTELEARADKALNGDNNATQEELLQLYHETMRVSEELPEEWGFGKGRSEETERITELLRDKGEISEDKKRRGIGYGELSEYNILLTRVREDLAALKAEPDAPIRLWRNPSRLLSNLEKAGLPANGFPVSDYKPLNFMRFITDDEVDNYLSMGGHHSGGRLRVLSYFLQNHTPKEKTDFLKNEYGHGGGTWIGGGWDHAEPGKGINLKRPGCTDINLNWNQATRRTDELIKSGRFSAAVTPEQLIQYERLMLARAVNNFFYELPEEYQSPFAKKLDFNYPHEDEWAAIDGFLNDSARIGAVLGQVRYIFDNTPEEDKYYDRRKSCLELLAAFSEGTYTLFPGMAKIPAPEKIETHGRSVTPTTSLPTQTEGQLSLFDMEPPPILPSVEEQQAKLAQKQQEEPTAGADAPAVSLPAQSTAITQDEIDTLLLSVNDADKTRLAAQFAVNARSKEAVQLVRAIYGSIEETMPRLDGNAGYLGILGESTGVALVRGEGSSVPILERRAETLTLNWTAVIKRAAELAQAGRFAVIAPQIEQATEPEAQENSAVEGNAEQAEENRPEGKTPETETIPDAKTPKQESPAEHAAPPAPVELDFDTVAQTVLNRVMEDADYLQNLTEVKSRASLRNPCGWALEQSIRDHEQDEPEVFRRYFFDEDFNDDLFNFVLRQSWANRPALETAAPEQPATQTGTEQTTQTEQSGEVSTPDKQDSDSQTAAEPSAAPVIPPVSAQETPANPPPVFFVDWEKAKPDFDLNLYKDRNIIGYDKDGVEYALGRSGRLTYVTTTGAFWGGNSVPGNIYDQIEAYERGEVSDEQVRENYLAVLEAFKASKEKQQQPPEAESAQAETVQAEPALPEVSQPITPPSADFIPADLTKENPDLLEVLKTRLITPQDKEEISRLIKYNVTNDGLASFIANRFNGTATAMYLKSGELAAYAATDEGLHLEVTDRYDAVLFPWSDLAPVVRAIESEQPAERAAEHDVPAAPGSPDARESEPFMVVDGIARKNYNLFALRFPEITDGTFRSMTFENPETKRTLGIWHDNTNAGHIHFEISSYAQGGTKIYEPSVTFRANFENRMLTPIQYANTLTGEDIGLLSLPSPGDAKRLEELSVNIYEILSSISSQGFTLEKWDVFRDADGRELPAEPKENIEAFLKEQADREADAHFNVQRNMFTQTDAPAPASPEPPAHRPPGVNFRITDDHLGEGGAKTKFRNNIDAITTLHTVEAENRAATPEEQQILSRFIGWGGLPQAFDEKNKQWESEYRELKNLLSPKEYELAGGSTLNAHYTSPTVIKAMYEAVERMGFQTGNMLEPSCGVGNFFGLLPESMRGSKLYGVELDSVTARIAKLLYPKANIQEKGFEDTDTPDAFFDLAIGNVPFGNYSIADKRYDKQKFHIHDYFFAKALDQVRPGGVVAFITSKFTLDKNNPEVRKYLAQRAELLGAVRLPNNAFLKNAGTETTMDILFLQKRDRPMAIEPDWVHLGKTADGLPVNQYFLNNPEMLLGKMALDERMNNKYGRNDVTACLPVEGADLAEQLKTALLNIKGRYEEAELDDIEGIDNHAIPADPNVKNFSYAVADDTVYFRENSQMFPVELPAATLERIKSMVGLRDCVHELIALQLDEHSDEEIKLKQVELNRLYDRFSSAYGLINSQANSRAFNADNSYYLLCSLEVINEDNEFVRKADMFSRRTIKQKVVITHVDTASEALAVSLGEKACVDMAFMSKLTGRDEAALFNELRGVIFLDSALDGNPNHYTYRTADEFLSGNVREKLKKFSEAVNALPGDYPHIQAFRDNAEALTAAQPKDLSASEIAVRLGATWIAPEYVQQFMYELLKTSYKNKQECQVRYHEYSGEWQVTGKGKSVYNDILSTVTYGTSRMNAYQIIADTLNLRDVRVYDYSYDEHGNQTRVLNKKETTLAQQKQEQIKQAFKDWIWKDPVRRQTLVQEYNEKFNSVRPREYDGSHLTFSGISPEITMRLHQLNAVAHGIYGGNTLLAHVVGAGKTFEMVALAMESKRLGLCQKSLLAVPNHLTEQWAGEFLRLYPSANILVATKKDFEMRNRKKFCAKIATGDYDAVIIGHSQLEKIPMSQERQERLICNQLWEIEQGLQELEDSGGERFTIKQLAKTRKNLQARLKKLTESKKRDDVVTFEQLGVDRLFVDEAHGFKNLFLYTKMRNVAGLSTSEAQKSSDLFMKCRYMDELTGGKGVIFATGTPISNSMTEMYTMQRYLQYDTLAAKGLTHFDSWASIFGETQTSIELAPEGTGYRARTRFAKFHNLPELMNLFKDVADIKTADMLNLPVPEAKYESVIVEPSEIQQDLVQELSERAAAVHARLVEPYIDNMLKITTDGRKLGLDQRLIDPRLPDFEGSKVNACTDNVFRIWNDTKEDRLTQMVFCDFSTPNKDGRFNVYNDMKAKLLEKGIPENEIAFIHDADTETRKKELFAKVRQGKVRVLFGSTFKMGAGTNCQDKLIAIHDADCPWRPADLEQRAGRIVRQGNQNKTVYIYRYATSGTFDSYLWQTVESKQKFIAQIMSSKSPVRSCEDVDETALSYAEIKALCAGNPLIAEKMNLDIDVAKLRMLKSEHQSLHYRLEDDILRCYPEQIASVTERIAGIEKDMAAYEVERQKTVEIQTGIDGAAAATTKFPGMVINGVEYKEKEPAANALLEACTGVTGKEPLTVGSYMGFAVSIAKDDTFSLNHTFHLYLRGALTYKVDLSSDAFGNMTRINNALNGLPERLEGARTQLADYCKQQEEAKLELEKPFPLESELAEKETRLALLNAELNIDGDGGMDVINDPDTRDEAAKESGVDYEMNYEGDYEPPRASSAKGSPSFLDGIRAFASEKKPSVPGRKSAEHDL